MMKNQNQKGIMNLVNENYLFRCADLIGGWLAIKHCKSATDEEKNNSFMRLIYNTPLIYHIDPEILQSADNIEYCFNEMTIWCGNTFHSIEINYTEGPLTQRHKTGTLTKPARK